MKSERTTIGQIHYGRKFVTITTEDGGKRRLDVKTSAALRRANFSEKEVGEILDQGVLRRIASRDASCTLEGRTS